MTGQNVSIRWKRLLGWLLTMMGASYFMAAIVFLGARNENDYSYSMFTNSAIDLKLLVSLPVSLLVLALGVAFLFKHFDEIEITDPWMRKVGE
jgi:hypothetical protein